VLDAVREVRAPFSPAAVVAEFAALAQAMASQPSARQR
jgi:hypothetical protein